MCVLYVCCIYFTKKITQSLLKNKIINEENNADMQIKLRRVRTKAIWWAKFKTKMEA